MNKITENRRKFLKQMLTGAVVTAACPHLLLGKVTPDIKYDKNKNKILGVYHINLDEYPDLYELWKSILIRVDAIDGSWKDVLITRLDPEEYGQQFGAVWNICTHMGWEISKLHPELHIYICPHEGSTFGPTGKLLGGPAEWDLESYPIVNFDGDKNLYLEIYYYAGSSVEEQESLVYLKQNIPNPCNDITTIDYGTEKAGFLKIELFDLSGNKIAVIVNSQHNPGHYSVNFNTSNLPSGQYVYKLYQNASEIVKKLIIAK